MHWPPCWQGREQIPPSQLRPWKPAGQSHTPGWWLALLCKCQVAPGAEQLPPFMHCGEQTGKLQSLPSQPGRQMHLGGHIFCSVKRQAHLPEASQLPRLWHWRSHWGWGPSAKHSFLTFESTHIVFLLLYLSRSFSGVPASFLFLRCDEVAPPHFSPWEDLKPNWEAGNSGEVPRAGKPNWESLSLARDLASHGNVDGGVQKQVLFRNWFKAFLGYIHPTWSWDSSR